MTALATRFRRTPMLEQISPVLAEYTVSARPDSHGWYPVRDRYGRAVDVFRTAEGARVAARELLAGAARIDPHAVLGCHIVRV